MTFKQAKLAPLALAAALAGACFVPAAQAADQFVPLLV